MSDAVWKHAKELVPGDRIEVGTFVCRFNGHAANGHIWVTHERDGESELVSSFTDQYRYVGPPGSFAASRTET